MRTVLSTALIVAAVAAGSISFEDPQYSFDHYVADFRLNIATTELPQRKAVFEAELARVRAHNKKNLGWKEAINQFSHWTAEEKRKSSFGRNKNMARVHGDNLKSQQPLPANFQLRPVSELPQSVDWRDKGTIVNLFPILLNWTKPRPMHHHRRRFGRERSRLLRILLGFCLHGDN